MTQNDEISSDTTTNVIPDTLPPGAPDVGTPPTPQAQADPLAALKADVPNQADGLAQQIKQALIEGYSRGYNAAWKGGVGGLTPRQFFAALGTKGTAFLIRGQALRNFVNGQYPDANLPDVPSNYTITFNADHSVDVTEV